MLDRFGGYIKLESSDEPHQPRCLIAKMKFYLAFLVALALSGAANVHSSPVRDSNELHEIFEEFYALVPKDKVVEIVLEYVANDEEVQAVVEYVQTDAFKDLVKKVESIEDVINFYDYLHESGLDIYKVVNKLHEAIGLPPLVPGGNMRKVRITGGVAGLIADIKAVLPIDKIKALYEEKLETSAAFAELVERLSSPTFQKLIDALRANEEFQKIVQFAREHGVDVEHIKDLLSSILGLEFPYRHTRSTQDLHDDLEDFLAILPIDQITKIVMDYLENDPQILDVIEYLGSDDFEKLVQEVEAMKEARDVLAYLQESGLDAYGFLNTIHDLLGIPPFKPSYLNKRSITKAGGGLSGLIADIKAILPIDDIKALYYHKLENSLPFSNLIKRLSSQEFQDFVDAVLAKEEARVIIKKLKEHGVDLQAIADLLSTILGLHFPKPVHRAARNDLKDDLDDFLALLPVDEITEIALDYLANDVQVQEAIEYMQSEEFHKIVQEVEAMKEAKDVLAFLQESGLDAYGFLNTIHDLLGIPPFKPSYLNRRSLTKATGGIAGMIADIKAILPIDKIKDLYYEKLENSPAFIKLIERLSSQEFQDFVDAVLAKEEAQAILKKLKDHGVDLEAIADLLSTILGLHFPKPVHRAARNDLKDDLEDFLALLPIDEITDIALDYLANDVQVQEAIEYMQSEEFHKIVQEVEDMKEARDVLAFLQESGLDAYGFLNSIHDLLGIPPFKPSYLTKRSLTKATGGIAGMIADIKAILPIDKIKDLYYEKLENSPAFIKLIERLSSQEFQDFVDAVLAKEEAQAILKKLKDHGVDLEAIADLLSTILGLHFPKPALRVNDELIEDLKDFLALVPLEEVIDIAVDYVLNDPDVQKAAVYVRSEEFKKLATAAQQNDEFRTFIGYLDNSGLPASRFINNINVFLGIPEVVPSALRRSLRAGGGVRGMLDAIEATLPQEEIKALYEYKKKNSKAFSYMVERLESPELQSIVDKLVENKDFQNLGYQAAEFGIDLEAIIEFLSRVFGIEISEGLLPRSLRSLHDDLQEFIDLLPIKKIRSIVVRYIVLDKEVKAAVAYVRSQEFAQLIKDLNEVPEYQDLLKSLEAAGLDIYTYIEKIHKIIGIQSKVYSRYARKTGGIAGLVEELKAVLPVDEIKVLYNKKLETSEDFVGLVELISSDKFQAVTDALFANKIFQDILHRLQSRGIDLQVVADFFLKIFGITTPPGIIDYRFRL